MIDPIKKAESIYDSGPKFPFLNQVNRQAWVEKIAEGLVEYADSELKKFKSAFQESELHDFYEWEIEKHATEYEVEFRGNEIKKLKAEIVVLEQANHVLSEELKDSK